MSKQLKSLRPKSTIIAIVLACAAFLSPQAAAISVGFSKVTNNNVENLSSQLSVDITEGLSGALFTFYNNVGIASSITDIYFDQGTTSLFSSINVIDDSGDGVSFSAGANPSNLPGGNPIGFSAHFSADSDAPVSQNGVNSSTEWVQFLGTFNVGTYANLLESLASNDFRIGLHVQSIGIAGGSDGYVSGITSLPSTVPVPAAAWLFGSALFGLFAVSRRKKMKMLTNN